MVAQNGETIFRCHTICGESVAGEVLISPEAICFYMIDSDTGKIIEKNHALDGQSITDKILVLPNGKGSSVVQDEGLYMLKQKKTGPAGIIVEIPDTVLVAGALVMGYPLFDKVNDGFYECIKNGDRVRVDAVKEIIHLKSRNFFV